MDKQDMKDLIRAWECFMKLNKNVERLTGGEIDAVKYKDLYLICSVIKRNSKYSGTEDEDCDRFTEILFDASLSVAKKAEKLTS